MATALPHAYARLLEQLERLPGIGRRGAERIAFHLIQSPDAEGLALAAAIHDFTQGLCVCGQCGHVSDTDPCPICTDPKRDPAQILVVERPLDVLSFEQVGHWRGHYHVLFGRLAPMEGTRPGDLRCAELLARLATHPRTEVVLATSPTLEGDGTAAYLAEQIHAAAPGVRITRIAQGLPVGTSLQSTSKASLSYALRGRLDWSAR